MAVARISKYIRENSVESPMKKARAEWKTAFDKYDEDKDGYINVKELSDLIENQEYEQELPLHVIQRIHSIADENKDGVLDFNEFAQMLQFSDLQPLFGKLVDRYIGFMVPKKAFNDRIHYHDTAKYCPPPLGMVAISIIEIILFCIDSSQASENQRGPIAKVLLYDPEKRYEAWRFVTYMFVHDGLFHLIINIAIQLFLGVPLELVHRWWRVLIIYFAGVLAGSLVASIVDRNSLLLGASGGVYAIITAHIAAIILNWKEIDHRVVHFIIFTVFVSCDIGISIYKRYGQNVQDRVSIAAHFAGAVAGFLMGINVVQNIKVTKFEIVLWWISVITYSILMAIAIIWHIAWTSYFPKQVYDV
ncbi:hypothetical protein FQA39_LY16832 [Lamprigera yunnana]|nr:hypothetical protein FQA39_LY16832 [Lamprigera yunnana]